MSVVVRRRRLVRNGKGCNQLRVGQIPQRSHQPSGAHVIGAAKSAAMAFWVFLGFSLVCVAQTWPVRQECLALR